MTDPYSAPRRRRRRSGRHRQPERPQASSPLPPEEARRNRDAAFGTPNPKRTWIGATPDPAPSPDPAKPSQASADGAPTDRTSAPRTPAPASPAAQPPAAAGPVTPRRPRGRRAAFPLSELSDSPVSRTAGADAASPGHSTPGTAAQEAATGRSRALPVEPRTEQDLWATSADSTSDSTARTIAGSTSGTASGVPARGVAAATADPAPSPASASPAAASPGAPDDGADAWTVSDDAEGSAADSLAPGADDPAQVDESDRQTSPSAQPVQKSPLPLRSPASEGRSSRAAWLSGVGAGAAASTSAAAAGGSGGDGPRSPASPDRGGSGDDHSSGRSGDQDGSLPRVAAWTVATSVLPGTGLLTTRMRRLGWVLLGVLGLAIVAAIVFLLVGDPLRTAIMLASRRGVLIAAMLTVAVVGIVWALQIMLANLAHSTREHLAGAKRYLALGLAALMVVVVAVPFGRGVQSLWALQGLVGSETVFGGDSTREHPFTAGKDPWANTERLNIMLLGQDAGADRTGTRPDTIMVASIDTATGQTALFSIPRNLERVRFPEGTPAGEEFPDGFDYFGKNQNLINAVWTWAEDRPDLFPNDPEPGLTATRWAVEETLGLEMDYYAMVNLQGFEDMVNALGGVDLVVERRIPIGGGASEVEDYIEPGAQKLDGFHALWYARSREGSNDFNRMCRQQRIVRAVAEEADPTTLALSIPGLVNATEENIETDIPVGNLDAFMDLALRIKSGGFTSYPITQDVTFTGNPDWDYLKEWVQASIEDSMKNDEPESVKGETEPGSTDPAETGAPPEEETSGEATPTEGSSEETPTEDPTSEESSTPTDEESASSTPVIEKDPLKSCLPGYEE